VCFDMGWSLVNGGRVFGGGVWSGLTGRFVL
jgi:hypothetical protein